MLWQVLNALPVLPKKERVIRIVTYAVPTAPGRARVIYRFFRVCLQSCDHKEDR